MPHRKSFGRAVGACQPAPVDLGAIGGGVDAEHADAGDGGHDDSELRANVIDEKTGSSSGVERMNSTISVMAVDT